MNDETLNGRTYCQTKFFDQKLPHMLNFEDVIIT